MKRKRLNIRQKMLAAVTALTVLACCAVAVSGYSASTSVSTAAPQVDAVARVNEPTVPGARATVSAASVPLAQDLAAPGAPGAPGVPAEDSVSSAADARYNDSDETSSPAVVQRDPLAAESLGLLRVQERSDGMEPGVVLADVAQGATIDSVAAYLAQTTGKEGFAVAVEAPGSLRIALPPSVGVDDAVDALRVSDLVESAQPNFQYPAQNDGLTMSAQTTTNDPYVVEGRLWALESIRAYEAWDTVRTNRTVAVAVLDDGFNVNHEDLVDNVLTQAAFNAQRYAYTRGMTVTDAMRDVSGGRGHGTHVAGIVAGTANNKKGVAGISYNAEIVPIKVFNDMTNIADTNTLVRAYDYLLDIADTYNIRVVNMSLGGGRTTTDWNDLDIRLKDKIDEAYERGIVTVVAACNEGYTSSRLYQPPFFCFPGDLDNVVTVISLKRDGHGNPVREDKSNYNRYGQATKNISAPGNLIWSTYISDNDDYGRLSGTSMASPYVAGTLALLFAADDTLHTTWSRDAAEAAVSRLYSSARDLAYSNTLEKAPVGWDVFTGVGEVDAAAAVAPNAISVQGAAALNVGATTTFSLTPQQSGTWIWSSSDTSIATVDARTGVVRGIKAGTAVITAQNEAGSRFGVKTLSVYNPTITGPAVVTVAETASYSVPAVPLGSYVWSTSNAAVATVNGSGVLTAHTAGTVTVTVRLATNSSISASKTITVQGRSLTNATVSVPAQTYTGRALHPVPRVVVVGVVLSLGTHFTVSYGANVSAGMGSLVITGKGGVTGTKTVTFTIAKAPQPFSVKAATKKVAQSKVKKKSVVVKPLAVQGAKGTVRYAKASGNAKITVNTKTGALTCKKGLKKGTYKVSIKVSVAGTSNYNAATKTVVTTIKVA